MSLFVRVRQGEPIERALRRLKKMTDLEGVGKSLKAHRFYEKPSIRRRRKLKAAQKYNRSGFPGRK